MSSANFWTAAPGRSITFRAALAVSVVVPAMVVSAMGVVKDASTLVVAETVSVLAAVKSTSVAVVSVAAAQSVSVATV